VCESFDIDHLQQQSNKEQLMLRTLISVLLLFASLMGQAWGAEYTVKTGDTLSKIARAHQTNWKVLAQENGIKNPNRIFPGQKLIVGEATIAVAKAPNVPSTSTAPTDKAECAQAAQPYEVGRASWYGNPYHGRITASGERYDMHTMTVAHRTLPFHTKLCITNPANGRSVVVKTNDRGPFTCQKEKKGKLVEVPVGPKDPCTQTRVVDLSFKVATILGITGVSPVSISVLEWPTQKSRQSARRTQVGQERKAYVNPATQLNSTPPASTDHQLSVVRESAVQVLVNFYVTYEHRSPQEAEQLAQQEVTSIMATLNAPVVPSAPDEIPVP
jgi:rare lipoprotein A